MENKKIKLFEAFAGIGSQIRALNNICKNSIKSQGMAEWSVPAILIYQTIHSNLLEKINEKFIDRKVMVEFLSSKSLSWDSKKLINKKYWQRLKNEKLTIIYLAVKNSEKEGNIFDVKDLYKNDLSEIDLLTYSFPCQDLSQQGKKNGMAKNGGTRSGLLWEVEKALDYNKQIPKYLLMENVNAILFKHNREDLNKWLIKLESLGYKNDIQVLNSADFGSPQARKRVFMLSTLYKKTDLPKGIEKPKPLSLIIDFNVENKYFLDRLEKYQKTKFKLTKSNINKCSLINYSNFNSESYIYDINYTGPTLTASGANSRIKVIDNKKIRSLTPLECFRYMGFKDEDYWKVKKLNILTDNQLIYACGNSISIEVLEKIMEVVMKNEK